MFSHEIIVSSPCSVAVYSDSHGTCVPYIVCRIVCVFFCTELITTLLQSYMKN